MSLFKSNATLSWIFVKYNTAILSRAAVERLFSLGKDVLKQKRSGLSDQWRIYRMRQVKHLPQASPFCGALFMAFRIAIQLY